MLTLSIISTTLFFGFIIFNVFKFGILTSYSSYGTEWAKITKRTNLWGAITVISAFLITPPLIEAGTNNPLQFIGFFLPVYLMAVGLTPKWEIDTKQQFWHVFFAIFCIIFGIMWLVLFKTCYFQFFFIGILIIIESVITKTGKDCYVFWFEMLMFLSVFGSLFL